jgi:hypothetical protein
MKVFEKGGAWSRNGISEKWLKIFWSKTWKGKKTWEIQRKLDDIKMDLHEQGMRIWTGYFLIGMGTSVDISQTYIFIFEFFKASNLLIHWTNVDLKNSDLWVFFHKYEWNKTLFEN